MTLSDRSRSPEPADYPSPRFEGDYSAAHIETSDRSIALVPSPSPIVHSSSSQRGVSAVLGFILIFGIVVISWTAYQGIAVPEQNRDVELTHNQRVHNEFQDLRNAILTSASTGTTQTAPITLGATYPHRTLASNLGVSAGTVVTIDYESAPVIEIDNAEAIDPHGDIDDFWNGSTHAYSTSAIAYRPVYSFYTNPPETVYENTIVYNQFQNGANVTVADQTLVNGRRLSLVAVQGDLAESGQDAVSVTVEPVSASTTRVAIRNESQPITIRLPTRLPAATWEDLLEDEVEEAGGHVVDVRQAGPNRVAIDLEANVTYELRLAKTVVGTGPTPEPAAYLALAESPGSTLIQVGQYTTVVEVRDRFNNPVGGTSVTGEINGGEFTSGGNEQVVSSGIDGQARFEFVPTTNDSVELEFEIQGGSQDHQVVEVTAAVVAPGENGDGNGD